ncbi:MAG: SRPBCC family protein [Promethearchaeota archaeon]
MKIEKKIEINASPSMLFGIVSDGNIASRWNPALSDVIEQEEGGKFLLKSDIGDILIVDSESIENEHVTWHMENSDMDSIGYIVEPKGDLTEVTLWTEFENKKLRKGYEKAAALVLKGLKNYVDFIEEGGDPEDFDKKQIIVSP